MPILAISSGTVTAVWGSAYIRKPNGTLKALNVGDKVGHGAQILTTMDGIVQISPSKGAPILVKVPADADKAIAGIESRDAELVPGAGLFGGPDGGLQPGLRVERVKESVGQLEFEFGTERVPPATPLPFSAPKQYFPASDVTVDDRPLVGAVSSPRIAESGNLDFQIRLTSPVATATEVALKLGNGTATPGVDTGAPLVSFDGGKNFTPISVSADGAATITVPAGTAADQVVVRVPTLADKFTEGDETFKVSASTPAQTVASEGTGTIIDATGQPRLSISGLADVNEAAGTVTYTVTLSNPSGAPVTVNYGTVDVSAQLGKDFTATAGTLTFAPNELTKTITVAITNDGTYEGAESFKVQLSNPTGAVITTDQVTTTIHDDGTGTLPDGGTPDDDRPAVGSVSSPTIGEGGNLDFQVKLTHPSTTDTTVKLTLGNGTATPGSDTGAPQVSFDGGQHFNPITVDAQGNAVITVPANTPADQIVVRVPTLPDNVSEAAETFKVTASTPINATPVEGTGTITDATGQPKLSISGPVDVNEAASTITYTVSLSNPSATPVTVNYGTADVSTQLGKDFTATAGTLTFAPNELTKTITVAITNDGTYEGVESFKVQLSNPIGAVITTDQVTTTIHDDGTGTLPNGGSPDDDRPAVGSVSSPTIGEGGNLDFQVKLTHPSTTDTTVKLTLGNGTATPGTDTGAPQVSFDGGQHFSPITVDAQGNAVITVPANTPADQIVVRVPTLPDNVSEAAETFKVTASTPINATPVEGTGTITDATGQPKLSITGPADVNEAAGTITYTVTLSNPSATPVTVNYGTVNGGAELGKDFTATAGTLTFAPNELTKTITVSITNDGTYEGAESFKVQLSNPTGAVITTDQVTTTIHDDGTGTLPNGGMPDDDRPAVGSVSSPTIGEGGNLDFQVKLTHPSTTDTTIKLTLGNGTATPGSDTGAPQVSFDGGQHFSPITVDAQGNAVITVPASTPADQIVVRVPTLPDNVSEAAETFKVTASTPINAAPVEGIGTITDATGQPTLSISGPADVNEAAGTITYTVTLSNPSSTPVTVNYGTVNGSAELGKDFTATAGTLTFAPNELTKTITVVITNDGTYEGTENFKVQLSNPAGAVITTDQVTTTIHDDGTGTLPNGGTPDDDRPAVGSVSSPTIGEGGNLDFQVKLTHPSTTDTTIKLTLGNGTATSGTDTGAPQVSFNGGKNFNPITVDAQGNAVITVPANTPADQIVVRVPTLPDNVSEAAETFKVTASTPINATPVEGIGTITDATGQPKLSITGPADVNEAAGTITYTVTLSNPSSTPVTVNYATVDGSAQLGKDFTATAGTLTFAPNELTKTITVAITNDGTYEGAENFKVQLSNSTGAVITTDQVTTTIHDDGTGTLPNGGTPDDDRPAVGSVSSPTIGEGGNLDFQVKLTHPSTTDTTVKLTLGNGTATPGTDTGTPQVSFDGGQHFSPITVDAQGNAVITVPANTPADQIVVRVPTLPDNVSEVAETFKVTASTPINATPVEGTGTITDATGQPKLSISGPADVNEAAGTITYTVTLSNPSATPVTVNYGTVDGSAQLGKDFTAIAGTLTFAPNELTKTITVAITNDGTYEGAESFKVQLSNPTGAVITTEQVTTTIHDDGTGTLPNGGTPDDDRPAVASVSSPTIGEGGNLDFQVKLTHPSTTDTTIKLTLGDGTTPGTATPGIDTGAPQVSFDGGQHFSPITVDAQGNAQITVPANTPADQIVVRVPTLPDNVSEAAETFKVTASTPINATPVEGTGTITDATGQPKLSISGPADVNEAAGTITYTVTLSNPSATPVTVNYGTVDGSAQLGKDFTAIAGTLTFAPNELTKTITVSITNDGTYEGAENFKVQLSNPTGAVITTEQVTTTIHDDGTGTLPNGGTPDDDRPAVGSVSSPTIGEGGNLDFQVKLTHPSTTDTTIKLTLGDGTTPGTATPGIDTGAPQVSFDGGKNFNPITVDAQGNAVITVPASTPADQIVVRVPTLPDNVSEAAETFKVTASTPINAVPVEGTGTITDATGLPKLTVTGPADVNEATGTITYTVTLSNPSSTPVTVNYGSVDGSAQLGEDFTATAGTLTFAPNELTKTITVAITNDGTYEGAESFKVQLSNPTGAVITTDQVTTTIHDDGTGTLPNGGTPDDDRPAVGSVSSPTIGEGGNLDFQVKLTHPSTTDTTITLKLGDGAASGSTPGIATPGTDTGAPQVSFDGGQHFNPITVDAQGNAVITVPANTPADQIVVRVPTLPDNVSEAAETFKVTASTPINATPVEGTGTITDSTGQPKLSITGPADVNEAAGSITYTVTLSNPSSTPVTVNYGSVDGSAQLGKDFTATAGTLTFAPNELTKTITVAITNDGTYEGAESFKVQLSNPTGAVITTDQVTTTIRDDGTGTLPNGGTPDDDRPAVGSVSSPMIGEGGNLDFQVTLTHPSTTDTTIKLTLGNGTATPGTDTGAPQVSFDGGQHFNPITVDAQGNAVITVPANTPADQIVVRVPTLPDNVSEAAETFKVTASTPINAAPVEGTGTITDATGQPKLSITGPADVNEAAGTITYTVSLSNPSATPVTVNYGTVNGSAELGKDFTATAGTLTFAPNELTKTITVAITNDGTYEGAESFKVQLSNPTGAVITTEQVTTTIHDDGTGTLLNGGTPDDDRPVLVINNPTAAEGTAVVFSVNLGHPSSAIQPLQLTLQNGTAKLGSDFTSAMEVSYDNGQTWQSAATGVANVPVGKDSLLVRVPTLDDAISESSESFTLNVSSPVAANGNVTGTATITDNDAPPTLDLDGNNSSGAADPGFKATYVENSAGIRIADADVQIKDVDSSQLTGATIKLTNPQVGDVLALAENLPAGITATVNGATIVLTGAASLTDYQTALHAIAFSSTSDNPSTLDRTVDIAVTDGTSDSNVATSVISVQAVNDAPAVGSATGSLSEEGLAGGVKDTAGNPDTTDVTTISGKITIADPDSSTFSVSLGAPVAPVYATNGTQINWVSDGQGGLIGKAGTAASAPTVMTATIDNTGQYTVTLLSSLKHTVQGEDSLGMNFTVKVNDGAAISTSTLTVNVEDDAPSAPAVQSNTLSVQDSNLLFVLDISGSMNDPSGIGTATRLQAAVQSMQKLLDKYDDLGTVAVRLVTFSDTAQTVGSSWLSVADAKTKLATITASGGTNYDYALSTAQTAFATTTGKITGAQNVAYFFSDGNPTLSSTNPTANGTQDGSTTQANLGDGIDATEESNWSTFLNNNQINAFAIGLGTGVAQTYLNPIAYNGQFALNQDGIVVSNLNQLDSTLSGTVTGSVSGQIFASGNVGGAALGADGGHLASITLGGTVYTYDAAHPTLSVTTPLGSPFTLDWPTGSYTYKAPDHLVNSQSETIGYSMVDGDGDIVNSSLQLNLVLNAPVAGAPTLTATKAHVSEEGLAGANKDTAGVTPGADTTDSTSGTGHITVSTTGGATVSGLVLTAPSSSVITASGKTVVWSSDNAGGLIGKDGTDAGAATVATISVTKAGDYTFNLLQAIQHAGSGEDVKDINFGVKVLDSTGKIGLGQLTVSVEDDSPVPGPAIVENLNTLDTNLMIVLDTSASMDNASGVAGLSRLDAAVQSIEKLLDKYDDLGGVSVRLVTFNTNAQTQGANWMSVAQAKALLGTITADGGTNYDYALTQAQAAFNSGTGKITGAQNVSYFFSDGDPTLSSTNPTPGILQNGNLTQPSLGDGIDANEESAWLSFLNANQIKSYAIGLGTGVTAPYLNPVAYDGQASENLNGTVVTSLDQLDTALSSTYGETISGNFLTSGKATAPMGADGFGHVDSVTVDGVVHHYNAATPSITIHTALGGDLTVDMSTGAYTYGAPGQLPGAATETVSFSLADKDGDTASSTLAINLEHTLVLVGTAQADTHSASQPSEFMMGRDGNDVLTGSDTSDRLYGNGGNDVLNGGKGDDVIYGGDGNDTLSGGDGADVISGGPGSDSLTGGAGADVFVWHFADPGAASSTRAIDTIKDFSIADGDKLDLRDLLQSENTGNLQNYLEFDTSTANTILKISPTGNFPFGNASNGAETERIVLENVNLRTGLGLTNAATDQDVITKLLTQGKLLVDQV